MSKTVRDFNPKAGDIKSDLEVDLDGQVLRWKSTGYEVSFIPLINGSLDESINYFIRKYYESGKWSESCPKVFRKQKIRSDRRRLNVELQHHLTDGLEEEFIGAESYLPYWD